MNKKWKNRRAMEVKISEMQVKGKEEGKKWIVGRIFLMKEEKERWRNY